MTRTGISAIVALAAALLLPGPARADESAPSGKVLSYRVEAGQIRIGDSYLAAKTIAIDGTHQGDLNGFADSIRISGLLTGDLQAGGQTVNVDGTVGDSARVIAQSVQVNGTIDGDLLVFAGSLSLGPSAHVTGRLFAVVQQMTMDGTVDGPVYATGGEISMAGHAGQNVKIHAESVAFDPGATIGGDLEYTTREELAADARPSVAGEIRYEPEREDDERDSERSGLRPSSVLWWLAKACAAFLVGLVGLSLFRSAGGEIVATVGREWALALGSGFITFVVVPVVGTLACVLLVTIPLMMIAFVLYLALLYVAKIPVAIWVGQRILRAAGRTSPSPVASLALGVALLYALFEIPVLGFLVFWIGSLCIGLGAIVLGTRLHIRSRRPLVAPAAGSGG